MDRSTALVWAEKIKLLAADRRIILSPTWIDRQRLPYHTVITFVGDWICYLASVPSAPHKKTLIFSRFLGRVVGGVPEGSKGLWVQAYRSVYDLRHRRFVYVQANSNPVFLRWSVVLVTIGDMRRLADTPYSHNAHAPCPLFSKHMADALLARTGCSDAHVEKFLVSHPALALASVFY